MALDMVKKVQPSPIIARCIWALMAAVHAPALIGVWRSYITSGFAPDRAAGCVVLTLSMIFFVLKVRGIGFLRFRVGKRAWVAMILTVALIHVDAIRPERQHTFRTETAVLFATTSIIVGLTRIPPAFRAAGTRHVSSTDPRSSTLRSAGTVWLGKSRPHCRVLAEHLFILRGPPA